MSPQWRKVSHFSFSVQDAESSAAWARRVLGMEDLDRVAGTGWHGVLLRHPPSETVLEYQQHDHGSHDRFDPRRTGLDHIGLLVHSRASLDDWAAHFEEQGVDYTPVAEREYGAVLTFRDPDGIQLEMFWREDHP